MENKLICSTIKPNLEDKLKLYDLLDAGTDIVRLPFWLVSEEPLIENIRRIKEYNSKKGKNIQILLDVPGNKIRFGRFKLDPVIFKLNQSYMLFEGKESLDEFHLGVDYSGIVDLCDVGDKLICGDGDAVLIVKNKLENQLEVVSTTHNATLYSKKGISITNKDKHLRFSEYEFIHYAIDFSCKHDINWFALSFTGSSKEINHIKQKLYQRDRNDIKVMAKIESLDGVINMENIIQASDGIMVARGDLSTYVDYGLMGIYQKELLTLSQKYNKFSIVSTGVMMSALNKARPRPAEINDIVNSIIDGANCIQFCEETAHNENGTNIVIMARHIIDSTLNYLKHKKYSKI